MELLKNAAAQWYPRVSESDPEQGAGTGSAGASPGESQVSFGVRGVIYVHRTPPAHT